MGEKMTNRRSAALMSGLVALMCWGSSGFAQESDHSGPEVFGKKVDISGGFMTTTGSSTSTAVSVLAGGSDGFQDLDLCDEQLREQLEHDRAGLAEAIALGAGDSYHDLMRVLGLNAPQRAAFAGALRARRAELVKLLREEPDPRRAARRLVEELALGFEARGVVWRLAGASTSRGQ
jgi:hypothetical protein